MKNIKAIFSNCTIVVAVIGYFITGCSNAPQENQAAGKVDSIAKANEQALAEADQMIKSFPTPFEITQMLNKAGASYILDISNPFDNAEKYATTKSRALNIGIYGADLCYASTYNKKQETTNYLAASQKLAEKLEIANMFDQAVHDRMNKNFDKKDSLVSLLSKQFSTMYETLNKAGRSNVSALSVTGAVMEGIYITTQLAAFAKDNKELKKIIAGQKESLKKLAALLSLYKEDTDIQEVTLKIREISTMMEGLTETMTNDQLTEFSRKLEIIRNEFVK